MDSIKVNTDIVRTCSDNIRNINNKMRDDFADVEQAMSNLDSVWDGSAAANAISKFNAMKSSYCDARYTVLDNYVNFLLTQIGEGYESTENTNVSLAEAFK